MEGRSTESLNVWVLGGSGFIGSEVVRQLRCMEHIRLHQLMHKRRPGAAGEGTRTIEGDLATIDASWMDRFPPDVLFHLARMSGSSAWRRKWAATRGRRANRRLASILSSLDRPPVIVYVSGSLMYGPMAEGGKALETTSLNPAAFARHYIRAELPWLELRDHSKLDIRFTRPGWIVGPSSWFRHFFWDYYLQHGCVPVYGDGSQWMSVVSLSSCAGQIIGWGLGGIPRQDLNVFEGPPVRQRDFSSTLAALLECETKDVGPTDMPRGQRHPNFEALTMSIPMGSVHGLTDSTAAERRSLADVLRSVIGQLKDE